jgi:poly(A) polymerase Pap1
MEQLNRKTKEEKTMPIFTTNWYLYKTYLHPISAKSQKRDATTATDSYKSKTSSSPNNVNKKTMDFEELLREAIDEGLSLLGESAKQVVYFHLEKTFKMNRLDIPYRIEEFIDAIDKIFGTGAKILEIQIMKCLFKRVGCTIRQYPEQNGLEFAEYVEAVKLTKKKYENNNEPLPN